MENKQAAPPEDTRRAKQFRGTQSLERLRFEMMISALSNSFINVPSDKIDQEIESGLRRIVEFIGFDRVSLVQESDDGYFVNTHIWSRPGIEVVGTYNAEMRYPELSEYFTKNRKPLMK